MAQKRLFVFPEEVMTAKQLDQLGLIPDYDKGSPMVEITGSRRFKLKFDKDENIILPEAK